MKSIKEKIIVSFSVVLLSLLAIAFTPSGTGYQVGDTVKDFSLKNIDGKNVSLSGLKNNKGAIVIFTCNHCPFSVAYEDRIVALNRKYASQGFPVIAINPNDATKVPDDSFSKMQERAKEKNFTFPYLQDATQETAKAFGAARTPHVFLLTKSGADYKVAYIGAIDNNTDEPEAATQKYVETAISEILAGKPVSTNFTKAIGCTIKWKSL
jgi:peroxiredoxin